MTGSRCEEDRAFERCEQYSIALDIWYDMPNLNVGRHYHSSCAFNESTVYVFCGIAQSGKKYCNSIESININNKQAVWQVINVGAHIFPERQGAGVTQINQQEIIIFGGFSGKYCRDASIFNVQTQQMRKAAIQPDFDLFAFQMPSVQVSENEILTADWQSRRMISYSLNNRFKNIKDLRKIEIQ